MDDGSEMEVWTKLDGELGRSGGSGDSGKGGSQVTAAEAIAKRCLGFSRLSGLRAKIINLTVCIF